MSNILQFPAKASVGVIHGTCVESGEPIYLLEYVEGGGRTIVGEYTSLVDLAYAILEWKVDGVPVIDPSRGAA